MAGKVEHQSERSRAEGRPRRARLRAARWRRRLGLGERSQARRRRAAARLAARLRLGTDSNYALNVMTQAGLYAILTLSVGLVLGQAGQLSFGHSAFYGIGAYTCGLLVHQVRRAHLRGLDRRRASPPVSWPLIDRPSGAQAQVLLSCPRHHGAGPDIPCHRVRMEVGRRLQRVRTGARAQHLRLPLQRPDAQVLHGLGGLPPHPALPGAAAQVPGGQGAPRARGERDRFIDPGRAQRQLEAHRVRLQRRVLRSWPADCSPSSTARSLRRTSRSPPRCFPSS